MSSRIAVIAIDAVQPRPVADFWCAVLGWRVVEEDNHGVSIAAPDGSWPSIDVCAVPEGKAVKNRLHLDLRADGVTTAEELQRLLALGASRADVGQKPDVSWVVLSDPEGNESACSLVPCRMPNRRRSQPFRSGIGIRSVIREASDMTRLSGVRRPFGYRERSHTNLIGGEMSWIP